MLGRTNHVYPGVLPKYGPTNASGWQPNQPRFVLDADPCAVDYITDVTLRGKTILDADNSIETKFSDYTLRSTDQGLLFQHTTSRRDPF